MDKKQLTLREVSDLLLQKDIRTIKSYIEKGLIPAIAFDKSSLTVDAVLLAKELGVQNFDEPFITESEACEILGFPPTRKLTPQFCEQRGITMYRLGSSIQGMKFLFRKSDLVASQQVAIDVLPFGLEDEVRKRFRPITESHFWSIMKRFEASQEEKDILAMYLAGHHIDFIAQTLSKKSSSVKRIIDRGLRWFRISAPTIAEWVSVFANTEYASMKSEEVLELLKSAETTISRLEERLKLSQTIDVSDAEIDEAAAMTKILGTEITKLDLSVRLYNCLYYYEIKTLGDLIAYSHQEILSMRNMGKKSILEIQKILDDRGLKLRE